MVGKERTGERFSSPKERRGTGKKKPTKDGPRLWETQKPAQKKKAPGVYEKKRKKKKPRSNKEISINDEVCEKNMETRRLV